MKKTVLICEDDEGIIEVATIILQEKGYHVIPVMNCKNFLEKVEKNKPDLILLDLWMPDITGEELVYQLRDNDKTKHIPIIIVSANKDTEVIAKRSGADAFIAKPFDITQLEEMVEKYALKH